MLTYKLHSQSEQSRNEWKSLIPNLLKMSLDHLNPATPMLSLLFPWLLSQGNP